jgi:hypothetical protein
VAANDGAAQGIVDELNQYFRLPGCQNLITPWSGVPITSEQRLARATYVRLTDLQTYDDPASRDLLKKMNEAQRQGDTATAKELSAQHEKLLDELELTQLRRIAADESGAVDAALAREYIELRGRAKPGDLSKEAARAFGQRFGTVESAQTSTDGAATFGFARRNGVVIRMEYVMFCDSTGEAPALCAWLGRRDCRSLRYDVSAEFVGDEEPGTEEDGTLK